MNPPETSQPLAAVTPAQTQPGTVFAACYLLAGLAAVRVAAAVGALSARPEFDRYFSELRGEESAGQLARLGLVGLAVFSLLAAVVFVALAILTSKGFNAARIVTWIVVAFTVCINIGALTVGVYDAAPWYRRLSAIVAVATVGMATAVAWLLALPVSGAYFRGLRSGRAAEHVPRRHHAPQPLPAKPQPAGQESPEAPVFGSAEGYPLPGSSPKRGLVVGLVAGWLVLLLLFGGGVLAVSSIRAAQTPEPTAPRGTTTESAEDAAPIEARPEDAAPIEAPPEHTEPNKEAEPAYVTHAPPSDPCSPLAASAAQAGFTVVPEFAVPTSDPANQTVGCTVQITKADDYSGLVVVHATYVVRVDPPAADLWARDIFDDARASAIRRGKTVEDVPGLGQSTYIATGQIAGGPRRSLDLVMVDGNLVVRASGFGGLDDATAKNLLTATAQGFLSAG